VGWYGDPDALDALARQLEHDADGVRTRGRELVNAVADSRWRGDAAAAFRRAVDEDTHALDAAARELDEAAAALHRHAHELRERLARLRALERAVTGWFDDQLGRLAAAADALADAVTDPLGALRHVVSDPPWSAWRWQPGRLPASGDRAWLEVADYLGGRGVHL
jgi:uncharacterized protein YukE